MANIDDVAAMLDELLEETERRRETITTEVRDAAMNGMRQAIQKELTSAFNLPISAADEAVQRAEKAAKAAQYKIQQMETECSSIHLWMMFLPLSCFLLSGFGAALGIYIIARF
jgi:hypothetical protein